jgi:PAS domain S-box-containing protein
MSPDPEGENESASRGGVAPALEPGAGSGSAPGAVARRLLRAEDPEAVAAVTVDAVRAVLDRRAVVLVREHAEDGDGDRLCTLAASDGVDAPDVVVDGDGPWRALEEGRATAAEGSSPFEDGGLFLPLAAVGVLGVEGDPDRLRGADGDVVRALAADAAAAMDRAVRERTVRTERDRFATLFERAEDAIAEVAFRPEGTVVRDVNPAFESTFGVEASAVVGRDVDDVVVPPGDGREAPEATHDARDGGGVDREVGRLTSDGVRDFRLRTVASEGDAGFVVYADVTEHGRTTRALSRLHETARELVLAETVEEVAERTVRAAVDVLGFPVSGVRLYDPSTDALELVAASAATTEVMGERPTYGRDEGVVWEVYERGEPRVVDDVASLDDGFVRRGIESALYLPLGEHGTVSMGAPEPAGFDESDVRLGEILGATAEVALDRARRTSLLRRREAELERQNERLEEFASVVSHDLRNPLAVAQGYLDMAKAAAGPEAADDFERVERAHGRMDRLITDLLRLARQGQRVGETTTVSLAEAARGAWSAVETDGASLTVAADRKLAADPDRLASLLENLFRNSVEHGSTGSRPQADDSVEHGSTGSRPQADDSVEHGSTGSRPQADDSVEHGSTGSRSETDDSVEHGSTGSRPRAGDEVTDADRAVAVEVGPLPDGFYVADDGPGVPEDRRDRVFERGYSTTREGTGFGLSIVEEIAAAHGWTVAATEADGGGARFEVTGVDPGGSA